MLKSSWNLSSLPDQKEQKTILKVKKDPDKKKRETTKKLAAEQTNEAAESTH
jgi:hypothetical protein